jgi:hypothetical protein
MGCNNSTGTRIMNYKRGAAQLKSFTVKVEDPG